MGRPWWPEAGLATMLLALLSGCGGGSGERAEEPLRPLRVEHMTLVMPAGVNDDWPARVELVRVTDNRLVAQLLGIEAGSWFDEAGERFRLAHPEAFFDAWEIVPGTAAGPVGIEVDGDVSGVLFCKTSMPSPPLKFERDGDVTVHIGDEGCTLSGGEPSREPSLWDLLPF